MGNFDRGWEVSDDGINLGDALGLTAGSQDPWVAFLNAPVGSVFFHTDGRRFILTALPATTPANWVVSGSAAIGLGFGLLTIDGGLIYDSAGDALIKRAE
jgi:hypothetical protein